jgi:hypothetical protein
MTKSELKQIIKEEIYNALESKINEDNNVFSFLKKSPNYLITYNVTNYKRKAESPKPESSWDSKSYEYIISANSEEEAKDKFSQIWYDEAGLLEPSPKLNIKSVVTINDKKMINSFKNELHFF